MPHGLGRIRRSDAVATAHPTERTRRLRGGRRDADSA